jgi:hypothetical protein
MTTPAWETEFSIDIEADPRFAWAFMSDVANWNDPPAEFHLEGPFVAGAQGYTQFPGQPAQSWRLTDVQPSESYTLEFALNQASLVFTWRFASANGGARLTQHIALRGENVAEYIEQVRSTFSANLEPGMNRIGRLIDQAFSEQSNIL